MTTLNDDAVLLVHGFASHRSVMWPLALRLRSQGFRVFTWGYSSLFSSIGTHASRLRDLSKLQFSDGSRFHVVAHSMGSIIARAAFDLSPPSNLARLVLLAPPNKGSPVARIASRFLGKLIPPTMELSDSPTSFVNRLSNSGNLDIGVIAARFDLLVPERNTHLAFERAYETHFATHNSVLFSRAVCIQIANFLREGSFHRV
ncbi:esterase/lipase family protein [Pirellulaceae bacterium SH501]